MKSLLITASIIALCSCNPGSKSIFVELGNPSPIDREDELIVIPADSIEKMLGVIPDGKTLVVSLQDSIIPSQLDDLNGDGRWDELAFVCNVASGKKTEVVVKVIKKADVPAYPVRTNIRFARIIKEGEKYEEADSAARLAGYMSDSTKFYPQFEGPGWENDKIGFRNYFDERNGMDIFGKRIPDMVLDSVGINEVYHELRPWGMDILKVGNSLGAGSLGIYYHDSLYRLSAIDGATFHVVAEGPVRSILDFDFEEVKAGSLHVALKHRVSIVAGEYGYRSDVTVSHASDSFLLATGLVNMHSKELHTLDTAGLKVFYTHDQQSENKDTLGMAIILNKNDLVRFYKTDDQNVQIMNTYAMLLSIQTQKPVSFRFLAGWQLSDPRFSERTYFESVALNEAVKNANPVIYSLNVE
jgi:hypothetical protein